MRPFFLFFFRFFFPSIAEVRPIDLLTVIAVESFLSDEMLILFLLGPRAWSSSL